MEMKRGFTLIELIMVIAILGIVSTLAVMRIGNVRERAQRQVSIANQSAIGRAVDSYVTINDGGVDRLDSLIDDEVPYGHAEGFDVDGTILDPDGPGFYLGPDDVDHPLPSVYADQDSGLSRHLAEDVLLPYVLGQAEVDALARFGLRYVMRHATRALQSPRDAYGDRGDDGAYLPDSVETGLRPHESACIARAVTNHMVVAAVSPFTPAGRALYRDFGQQLLDTSRTADEYRGDRAGVLAEVKATGGALIAFGLGDECTMVGGAKGGIESAPYASYLLPRFYRRYLLLFRISTAAPDGRVEFAGVLDPGGLSIRAARAALQ